MSDLISRDATLKILCDTCPVYNCITRCSSYTHIETMASITQDNKISRWIPVEGAYGVAKGVYECSECGRTIFLDDEEDPYVDYPYCHCGAKMRGDENG